MDLKYLTKEGSWEKNPPDLQAEVLQGKRGRLLVTIYRARRRGLIPSGFCCVMASPVLKRILT